MKIWITYFPWGRFLLLLDDRLTAKWGLLLSKNLHGFNVIGQYCLGDVKVGTNVKPMN